VLAGFLKESNSGVIIVVNKWDLVAEKHSTTMNRYREYIASSLPFLDWAPVHFVSALTKQRVHTLFDEMDRVVAHRERILSEEQLQQFLQNATHKHLPAKGKGPSAPKLLGMKQVKTRPPTFDLMLKVKRTETLNVSYVRFLENRLREQREENLCGCP
jgi:GTP-binding protein